MANEVFGILFSNAPSVSGDTYLNEARDYEYFLRTVITPIYDVLRKVKIYSMDHHYLMLHFDFWSENKLCSSQRKQKEITEARQVIQVGETTMI